MRNADRKDANHAAIVDGLRRHGIIMLDMPEPGDVLCWHQGRNRWLPLEFKVKGGRLRPAQLKRRQAQRIRATRADGSRYWLDIPPIPIPIVATLDEALDVLTLNGFEIFRVRV